MGIDVLTAEFLLAARRDWGVEFRSTATLGHQNLNVTQAQLRALLNRFGAPEATCAALEPACGGFADDFLHYLGAEKIVSLDASGYEQATIIHDMNQPIEPGL